MTIVDPERLAAAGLAVELDDAVLTVTLNKPDRVLILPDGVEDLWNAEYADLVALA